MTIFEKDKGVEFGGWGDPVSRRMYETSLLDILPIADLRGKVGDYGGANGLLKKHVQGVTTIDIDPSKQPDVLADIVTYGGRFDVGWCRYVLHYLTDQQVLAFLRNVNVPRLIVVQFVNDDLRSKYANSINETAYFRTTSQLEALLPPHGSALLYRDKYVVDSSFYRNRLGLENAVPHMEEIRVYEIMK